MDKHYFSSLAFAFLFSFATCQGDFLVTVKGDTLAGRISFQQIGNVEQILVKGDKRQTIPSTQVRVASSKGKVYKPVQFSGKVQMMQILSDGYLSLLAFQPPGTMNYDGRLLMLRDGRSIEVPTLSFKKHVSNFLNDDAELAAQVKDGDLDRKDLDKIINSYNLFIEKNTESSKQQVAGEKTQTTKQEILDEIQEAVKNSKLESKNEVIEMLTELKSKISNNNPIPQFLSNALKDNLKSNPEWLVKLEQVLKE